MTGALLLRRLDERVHQGVPVYAMLYMFFWPWNAPYRPLGGLPIGAHVADLEHVRIIVEKRKLRIIQVWRPPLGTDLLMLPAWWCPNDPAPGGLNPQ